MVGTISNNFQENENAHGEDSLPLAFWDLLFYFLKIRGSFRFQQATPIFLLPRLTRTMEIGVYSGTLTISFRIHKGEKR